MAVDKETSALMRNTGVSRKHALAMVENRQHMAGLGVDVGELTKAHEALRGTMTDFSMMSEGQQRAIGENRRPLWLSRGYPLVITRKGCKRPPRPLD